MRLLTEVYYEAAEEIWNEAILELEKSSWNDKEAKRTVKTIDQFKKMIHNRMIEKYGADYKEFFIDNTQGE